MIKNIVFDLGNVLISFKPAEFLEKKKFPEMLRATILADIFSSNEWTLLDQGEINTREAIESITMKSSLKKEEIEHVFNLRKKLMFPLDQNIKLLPKLKKQGFKLYFLSNFPLDIYEEIKTGYYFFKYFDGGVISSEVKFTKPDRRIYEILIENYSLIPEDCLFIDDIEINVKAAEATGMKGLFTAGSLEISKELEIALLSSF